MTNVDVGSKLVDQAGATIDEVAEGVKRVTDIMAEITAASQEQSMGIEQVNQAVALMDAATQQNAALVEQAAAESMRNQASGLVDVVSVFKLDGVHRTSVPADITNAAGAPAALELGREAGRGYPIVPRNRKTLAQRQQGEWEE